MALPGDKHAIVYCPLTPSQRFLALDSGEIDILVGSLTMSSGRDARLSFDPVIFHEGKQRYAPLASNDAVWADTVSWLIYALIQAEEWGLSSDDIEAVADAVDQTALNRFLGLEGDLVEQLGLEPEARRQVIQEGNYGERYDRHLGSAASLNLARGPNRLWSNGGYCTRPLLTRARFTQKMNEVSLRRCNPTDA